MWSFGVLLFSWAVFMTAAAAESGEELPPALLKCVEDMATIIKKSAPEMKECEKTLEQESDEGFEKYQKCVDDVESKYPEVNEINTRCATVGEEATSAEATRAAALLSSRTEVLDELPLALLKCIEDVVAIATKTAPEMEECNKIPTESDEGMNKYDACVSGVKAKYPEVDEVDTRCEAAMNSATGSEMNRAAEMLRIRTAGLPL